MRTVYCVLRILGGGRSPPCECVCVLRIGVLCIAYFGVTLIIRDLVYDPLGDQLSQLSRERGKRETGR